MKYKPTIHNYNSCENAMSLKYMGGGGGIPLHTEYRNSPKFHELQALVLMVVGKKINNPLMKKIHHGLEK